MKKNRDLFSYSDDVVGNLLNKYDYPYEVLPNIHSYILEIGKKLGNDYYELKQDVWIHESVRIEDNVLIIGPAIIMENSVLRHNAYLRENVIVGPGCVIGNSCEVKGSVLISNCEIPHFNYVGDSILGDKAHLGAGAIITNLRLDKQNIHIEKIDTNLRKIGAFIGDNVQVGSNTVICPGTIIGKNTIIYPLMTVKGIIDENSVVKDNGVKVVRI